MVTHRCAALVLLGLAACSEVPLGEGPAPSAECPTLSPSAAPTNSQLLELGRLQGSTFVPLVPGDTFELSLSGTPPGWSILGAIRFPLESPTGIVRECAVGYATWASGAGAGLHGHPVRWVDEEPGLGRWTSAEQVSIVVGDDLDALLAGTSGPLEVVVSIPYPTGTFATASPPTTLTFVNREGFLSAP